LAVNSILGGGGTPKTKPRYVNSVMGTKNKQLNRTQGREGLVPVAPKAPAAPRPVVPVAPAPVSGGGSRAGGGAGGGGSAGGGAGGGGGSSTAAPTKTAALDLDAIRSALAAISAQFNFQEGTLTAEQEAAKRAFGFLSEQFGEQRQEGLTAVKGDAAGRGLLRSGLFLRASGDVSERFSKAKSQAQAERDSRLRGIATNLANLKAQEEAQRAQEARRIATEQVGTQEAIAAALKLV
jgi:hypothetical protein